MESIHNIPIVQCNVDGATTDQPPYVLVNEYAFRRLYENQKQNNYEAYATTAHQRREDALKSVVTLWWFSHVALNGKTYEKIKQTLTLSGLLLFFLIHFVPKLSKKRPRGNDHTRWFLVRVSFVIFFLVAWFSLLVFDIYDDYKVSFVMKFMLSLPFLMASLFF
jgi:hypothetical protein